LFAEHFRSASKDLKRSDKIDDLRPRCGHEHDPPRSRLDRGPRRTASPSRTGIISIFRHNSLKTGL
jgi:hypothetical protein